MEDWEKERKEILHGKLWMYAAIAGILVILYWIGKIF